MTKNDLSISLKQLRYFIVASQHSSLRQSALELGISQPSLSAQLRLLEESLDVVLFERSRGGVTLTPIGRELIAEANNALAAAESILKVAQLSSHGPSGTFRLGVAPSLGPYTLPWLLPKVRDKYRSVKFFVRESFTSKLITDLKAGVYDLIFSPMPIEDPNLTVLPVFREPIYLVVAKTHQLATAGTIRAEQLDGMSILTIEEQHLFFRQVEQLCKRFNANLLRDFEGTSLDAIRQMVYMELGAAFLPALYIRSEIKDRDELCVLKVEDEQMYRVHAMAWRNTSPMRTYYRSLHGFIQELSENVFGKDIIIQS
jgi:LysR family hydrogen peroxide-inducible transcriptional activator